MCYPQELDEYNPFSEEARLKKILHRLAVTSDVVLDLHSDSEALLHMYTQDHLWPLFADLAVCLDSQCQLLAPTEAGKCTDEAASWPWAALSNRYNEIMKDEKRRESKYIACPTKILTLFHTTISFQPGRRFPDYPIPMACHSATVELRGEADVSDELATKDAQALIRFMRHRGFLTGGQESSSQLSEDSLIRPATPLSGVDMVEAPVAGVLVYSKELGEVVKKGECLGHIICPMSGEETEIVSNQEGKIMIMKFRSFNALYIFKISYFAISVSWYFLF